MFNRCSFGRNALSRLCFLKTNRPAPGRHAFKLWSVILLALIATCGGSFASTLSDPQVDAYNVRVGTETFFAMYQFTTNTALVETAEAMTNMGSDIIKLYLASNTSDQSGVTLPPGVNSLVKLARDEPNYHKVFDMPFRHFVMWAYPFANSDEWWGSGYDATKGAKDYQEMYDVTRYFLTNYNNSGKTFYLGHWEGDGYLKVNNWTTNPSPATIQGMIGWLNNRQQAVDDAKRDTVYTNVNVFNYAEVNRVRDAMLNGPNNNQRVINMVIPYVTNLDCLSYSSYDSQNLSAANLDATLDYMETKLSTNKAALVPGPRMWIGEYGWGTKTTAVQEPMNRSYIQRLLNWNYNGQCLPFIIFWEMYSNFNPGGGTNFCLIDYLNQKTPSWYLHSYFANDARLLVAQFKETNHRLPNDTEFTSLVSPLLDQPLPVPLSLSFSNLQASLLTNTVAHLSGTLAQGIYGDSDAGVWVFWGRQDGGTTSGAWENSRFLGVNTNFNPATFSLTVSNLVPQTNYYFRFYSANATTSYWTPAAAQFSTASLAAGDFGSRLKITLSGYNRSEALVNFPLLVRLGTNVPGFSYQQFALPNGGDLRFADASGTRELPYEINQWNPGGVSTIWVQMPVLSSANDFIWAYWGNPALAARPAYSTNGSVWQPSFEAVYHLEQTGFPFLDSTLQYPAATGIAPPSVAGLMGQAGSFANSQYLNAGAVNLGGTFTLSAWVKVASGVNNIQGIWMNGPGGFGVAECAFYVNDYQTGDGSLIFATGNGTDGAQVNTPNGAVSFNQWHLVTASIDHDGGTAKLYVDGTLQGTGAIRNDFPTTQNMDLGKFTSGSFAFNGLIDEARISSDLSSSNLVWANWMTVASNATFESYSTVTQQPPVLVFDSAGGTGNFLTWPGSGVGFQLYTTTNLFDSSVWTIATNQPVLTNGQWQIGLPADPSGTRFYRLQSF
jgi:hypothetical protein